MDMDERELFNMVNNHSDEAQRQEHERQMFNMVNGNSNNARTATENAKRMSRSRNKIGYGKNKKKQNKNKIKIAITSIALIATILATSLGAKTAIDNFKISVDVDRTITQYSQMMDYQSGPDNAIETICEGRLEDRNDLNPKSEPYVDYTYSNIENLSNHLVEAAKVSELDTRCAIIAAYNIINETYENDVIGKALAKASTKQDETANYKLPNSSQELLEKLGYENWQEYHDNERKNIYELKEIELQTEKEMGGKQL